MLRRRCAGILKLGILIIQPVQEGVSSQRWQEPGKEGLKQGVCSLRQGGLRARGQAERESQDSVYIEALHSSLRSMLSHREESCGGQGVVSPGQVKPAKVLLKEQDFLFKFKITSPEASPNKVLARSPLEEETR